MKKVLFILFQLGTLVGQASSFDLLDVIVYSEYYFDGIMERMFLISRVNPIGAISTKKVSFIFKT